MRVYVEIFLFLSKSRCEGDELESRQKTLKKSRCGTNLVSYDLSLYSLNKDIDGRTIPHIWQNFVNISFFFCEGWFSVSITFPKFWSFSLLSIRNSFFINLPRSVSCKKDQLLACVVFSQHHPTVAKEILHKIECHMNSWRRIFG